MFDEQMRCAETAFHNEMKEKYEYVTLLMPTNPLRTAQHIKEAYKLLLEKKALTLVSVAEYKINPGMAMTISNGRLKSIYGKDGVKGFYRGIISGMLCLKDL